MDFSRTAKSLISNFSKSERYRESALRTLACGVSSTPRSVQLPIPIAIQRAYEAHVVDVDGNDYVDYAMGYGPLILGHTHPAIRDAIIKVLDHGMRTASVHTGEGELAEMLVEIVPSAEMVAFTNTGSEAVQLALRLARARTGKNKVIKFRANYHGWSDSISVANDFTTDGPSTIGQDPRAVESIHIIDWGDADALEATLDSGFAAVILEAAAINAGCFEPSPGFLERVREITRSKGVQLIFDEVITGFRLSLGGAQEKYGIVPDITVLGKALGMGLPISAVVGSRDSMQPLVTGELFHRGTFNGSPISVMAAIACVNELRENAEWIYPRIDGFAQVICRFINAEGVRLNVPVCANQVGSALQVFAGVTEVGQLRDVTKVDRSLTLKFTGELLRCGIFIIPRGLMYLSSAHTLDDIARTQTAITSAIENLRVHLR